MRSPAVLTPNAPATAQIRQMILAGWAVAGIFFWTISPFVFLPTVWETLQALSDLWTNYNLGQQLLTSLSLNIEAIVLSAILSLALAYLSTLPVLRPLVVAWGKLRFLSMYGLVFFFTLLATSGHELKLMVLVFGVSVFLTGSLADIISEIPQAEYDLARVLGMSPWRQLWEVVALGKSDEAWIAVRQNAAMSWLLISFVESIERSEGGVGALLAQQDHYMRISAVMAIQICVLVLGLVQDWLLGWMRELCCPWVREGRAR